MIDVSNCLNSRSKIGQALTEPELKEDSEV